MGFNNDIADYRDYIVFCTLSPIEKIMCLYDALEIGLHDSILSWKDNQMTSMQENFKEGTEFVINDVVLESGDVMTTIYTDDSIIINSHRLKPVKAFIVDLFMNGLILKRSNDDKLKHKFKTARYFRSYKVLGQQGPLSEN